jgi:nucleotide-binding universal stress UspA family protein
MVSSTDRPADSPTTFAGPKGSATRVLLATDGSEASQAAARVAAAMFPDGEFLLVTVIDELEDPMADAGGFEGPAMNEAEAREDHREEIVEAQGALATTARAFGARAIHQRILEHRGEGRGAKLCATATDEQADVLVVGSHGHGVLADALLGSISNYVVHHSTCPVLVVPSRTKK